MKKGFRAIRSNCGYDGNRWKSNTISETTERSQFIGRWTGFQRNQYFYSYETLSFKSTSLWQKGQWLFPGVTEMDAWQCGHSTS